MKTVEHRIVEIVSAGIVDGGGVVGLPGLVPVVAPNSHWRPSPPSDHLATNYHIVTPGPRKDFSSEAKFILKLEFQARFSLADYQTLWLPLHSVGADHLKEKNKLRDVYRGNIKPRYLVNNKHRV